MPILRSGDGMAGSEKFEKLNPDDARRLVTLLRDSFLHNQTKTITVSGIKLTTRNRKPVI